MKKIQRFLRGTALLAVLSLLVSATAFAASQPERISIPYNKSLSGISSLVLSPTTEALRSYNPSRAE